MFKANESMSPLLVNERTAARMLNLSPRTLWSLRRQGHIAATIIGRAVRYRVSELELFAQLGTGQKKAATNGQIEPPGQSGQGDGLR